MNESVNQEPESFIVQNVTLGPHYVSDIRLNFGPLQAIDLTWEDAKVIKASKDLRSSLRMGFLKKISPNQFDTIEEKAAIRGKKELLRQQNDNNLRTVDVDGMQVHLTNKEYAILELLAMRKGTVLTKEMFLNHLYSSMDEPEIKIIDVFVCKLRKKLSEASGGVNYIETVWGRGYMLKEYESDVDKNLILEDLNT